MSFNSNGNEVTVKEVDRHFFELLLGVNSQVNTGLNRLEQETVDQLKKLLKNNSELMNLLPSLPLILPKVMKVLRDENTTAIDVAKIIEEDPTLVADVIRLTNSPRYRTKEKITSLEQATAILGREGLKRLVACAIMKPLLNVKGGHFLKLSSRVLWEHSEKTSIAAYNLCRDLDEKQFYAYLAGLLQNIGLIIGLKVLDNVFDGTEAPNSCEFHKLFDNYCRRISTKVAGAWSMPKSIGDAFSAQENTDEIDNPSSLHVHLFLSDRVAKAQILADRIGLKAHDTKIMLNQELCQCCIDSLDAINYTAI